MISGFLSVKGQLKTSASGNSPETYRAGASVKMLLPSMHIPALYP